jgi:hypothetical protein
LDFGFWILDLILDWQPANPKSQIQNPIPNLKSKIQNRLFQVGPQFAGDGDDELAGGGAFEEEAARA